MLSTDQKGAIAEQAVVFEAVRHGLGVFQPLGDERLSERVRADAVARV